MQLKQKFRENSNEIATDDDADDDDVVTLPLSNYESVLYEWKIE